MGSILNKGKGIMLKKIICFISIFFLFSCATIQPKSDMYLPDCTPGEVIFITNTHENAWIEIADKVFVRRIDLRMVDEKCIMQQFSPPIFGFFTGGRKELHAFHLWKGEWVPSKNIPGKGYYNYVHVVTIEGNSVQRIYDLAADFIKTVLIKEKE
jgi:hypothetical protein